MDDDYYCQYASCLEVVEVDESNYAKVSALGMALLAIPIGYSKAYSSQELQANLHSPPLIYSRVVSDFEQLMTCSSFLSLELEVTSAGGDC